MGSRKEPEKTIEDGRHIRGQNFVTLINLEIIDPATIDQALKYQEAHQPASSENHVDIKLEKTE